MARQVLPWIGAAAGFAVTGTFQGAQAGFLIGSVIGNAVDPIEMQGRKLGDAPSQVAAEGGARAIVFGKGCIRSTCILERGGRRVIKQRDSSGGKGSGPTTVNERALWTFAIGLGEAIPGGAILRIWEQEKLVYDVTPTSTIPDDTAAFAEKFRFYDGSETQLPDPAIEAIHDDPEDAPYYRGTAYLVFPQRDLTDFGEAVPTYRVEVAAAALVTGGNWNAADVSAQALITGNGDTLTGTGMGGGSEDPGARSAYSASSGKVYFEFYIEQFTGSNGSEQPAVGFGSGSFALGADLLGLSEVSWGWAPSGRLRRNITESSPSNPFDSNRSGLPWVQGDTLSIALDLDNNHAWLGVNGVFGYVQNSIVNLSTPGDLNYNTWPITNDYSSQAPIFATAKVQNVVGGGPISRIVLHSRDGEFAYPIPDGFEALGGSSEIAGQPVSLSHVLAALHERCGHTSADYDVAEATDMLAGVVIEQTVTAAEAINSIIGGYFIDPSEYDGQIHYIKRGKPVVRTLTIDDLIDEPESNQRKNAIEYPLKVHFFYQGSAEAYASPKATSSRYSKDLQNVGEVSVASPVTFDSGQEPAEIAAKIHKVLWAQAEGEIVWHVTDEHLDLVASDCVGLSYRGELVRARITQIEDDPGQRKLKLVRDRQSAYTANITEIPVPPAPTPPQPSIPADTVLAVIDSSALTDNADTLHYLVAMSGDDDNWAGAALQQSLDTGVSFSTVDSTSLNAIMGTLLNTVAAASPYYTDGTNTVDVQLFTDDELQSRSLEAFLSNGGGFFLSWDDAGTTRWEILQFKDATLIAPKTYRLSTLLRGRRNTDAAEHPPGSTFVLIDTALLRESAQFAWLGTDLNHRAVSNGQSPEAADPQTNLYEGNSQREWPVANLILERDGDDIVATAIPRHRFGTEDNPIRSLNWTGYRWTASDGSNVITRDGTADAETFDATGWASPVTVTVAQTNRITGEGPTVSEDIE